MLTIRKPSHAARRFVSHWFSDIPSDDSATCSLLGKYSEAIHEGFYQLALALSRTELLFFYVLLSFKLKLDTHMLRY